MIALVRPAVIAIGRNTELRVWRSGIPNEITTLLSTCAIYQERLPNHQKEPMMTDLLPTHVFEDVSADLFQSGRFHVLVYADRLSGWPVIHRWKRDPTAREVMQAVIENFVELCVPMRFRSDNGPQFDAGIFRDAMERWGVARGNSTPHYSQSNGHAEAAVKAVKELVEKISSSGDLDTEEFQQGLLEFRNTPRENGLSPAQMLFGHQLRSIIPAHRSAYATCWKSVMEARDRQAATDVEAKTRYDVHARGLPLYQSARPYVCRTPLRSYGAMWEQSSRLAATVPTVLNCGSVLRRNRRFLRRLVQINVENETQDTQEPGSVNTETPTSNDNVTPESAQTVPWRGGRLRKPKIIVSM